MTMMTRIMAGVFGLILMIPTYTAFCLYRCGLQFESRADAAITIFLLCLGVIFVAVAIFG